MNDQANDTYGGTAIDPQEMDEREEAAQAYGKEDEKHFVTYCDACVEESRDATADVRKKMDECFKAWQTKIDYSDKEDWQSQAITNDPFVAVAQGTQVIRKAMEKPEAYKLEGVEVGDKDLTEFFRKAFKFWLNPQHVNFPLVVTDASEMAFILGQSMEMKVGWNSKEGLGVLLIEPWKIYRDPDALPRDPWSGNFWIHEEWVDRWKLKEGENDYVNIDVLKEDKKRDKEEEEKRKEYIWKRSEYRHYVRVREFWGTILDKKGELLLPNCRYMVGGDRVIRLPKAVEYVTIPWPGVSFSPFTHPLRYEGIGILEGVISLWWLMCNLLNLDVDNMNWVVNKIREIDISMMADPTNIEIYPGVDMVRKPNSQGPIITESSTDANTGDIMARLNYWSNKWENGSFANQFVSGTRGDKAQKTLGEIEMKTTQSLGVFDSIGRNFESGIVKCLWAIYETLVLNWTKVSDPNVQRVMGKDYDQSAMIFENLPEVARRQMLEDKCDITVEGISAQLQQIEQLQNLRVFVEMAESQVFGRDIKSYQLLRRMTELYGFHNADFILTEDEKKAMAQIQASKLFQLLPPEMQQSLIQMGSQILGLLKEKLLGGAQA